jgi:hypothetical protein
MPLNAPDKLNPVKRRNPRLLFLYGKEKIGKTTAVAQLPDSYLLELVHEGAGADYIEYKGSCIETLNDFDNALPQLRQWNIDKKFKRLVIDSIDSLVSWIEDRCTNAYQKSINKEKVGIVATVFELNFGKGHDMAVQLLKDYIAKLLGCCDELVFVGHCKAADKTEQTVIVKEVDLPGKLRNKVVYTADAAGYVFLQGKGDLWVTFHSADEIAGGSRSRHLAGQRIQLGTFVNGAMKADWSKIYLSEEEAKPQP